MKPSKPPAVATWMLEHLLWGGRNEALAGDLLEEFQRQRSVAWYWRQVLGAILSSLSNEVRADRVMIWTIVFVAFWVYGLYLYLLSLAAAHVPISAKSLFEGFLTAYGYDGRGFRHGVQFILPILLQVIVPLCIYLAVVGNLTLRALTRGLCAGMVATFALRILTLSSTVNFAVVHGLASHWRQLFLWFVMSINVIPLLAAMWLAQSGRRRSRPSIVSR